MILPSWKFIISYILKASKLIKASLIFYWEKDTNLGLIIYNNFGKLPIALRIIYFLNLSKIQKVNLMIINTFYPSSQIKMTMG